METPLTLLIGTSASLPVHLSITLMQLCPPAKPCRGPHWADGDWSAAYRGECPIMPPGWEEDLLADEDWIIIEPCNFWELLKKSLRAWSGKPIRSFWQVEMIVMWGFTQTCWRQFWNPYQLIRPRTKKIMWEKKHCARGEVKINLYHLSPQLEIYSIFMLHSGRNLHKVCFLNLLCCLARSKSTSPFLSLYRSYLLQCCQNDQTGALWPLHPDTLVN